MVGFSSVSLGGACSIGFGVGGISKARRMHYFPPPRHPPFYYRCWRFILSLSRPFSAPATRRAVSGCNSWSSYKSQIKSPMDDHYVGIGCRNLLDIGCHKSLLLVMITNTCGQHCGAWSASAKYISGQQQWSLTDRISFIRRTRMRRSLFFKI